jgi:hypothetical protein
MATKRATQQGREPASPALDPMVPVIRVAAQQIDAYPGGRLAWLLRFVREDPARWQPADREAHGNRLLAFVYTLPPHLLRRAELIEPLTPADAVETLQGELRDWLRRLVSSPVGTPVPVPTKDLVKALVRATAPGVKPAIFGVTYGGPRSTMLFQAVETLIHKAEGRLIACQECGEPILALRKRLFCPDGPCLQKWHDRERPKRRGGKGRGR